MAFPGTITVRHETLHATIRDWCDSFFPHGFRHVLIYSGHGGNAVPLARIIDDLTREDGGRSIIGCTDWSVYDGTLFPRAEALGVGQFEAGWHAGELETSMILALEERLVLMDRAAPGFIGDLAPLRDKLMREGVKAIAPTGVLGDPRSATRAHGEAYLDALDRKRDPLLPRRTRPARSEDGKDREGAGVTMWQTTTGQPGTRRAPHRGIFSAMVRIRHIRAGPAMRASPSTSI